MIPKKIHYCWFGHNKKSPEFEKFLATWKKHLPDYEIIEWNEDNFDVNVYRYSSEAYSMGCYAHVSDVCRIHVINEIGGIYFDTDVEVLASFDRFLKFESFLGTEHQHVGAGVIGAVARAPWLRKYLDYYSRRHFINPFGHPRRKANTEIITYIILPSIPAHEWPAIFPKDYFSAIDWHTKEAGITENTVSIHHYQSSWRHKRTLKDRIVILFRGIRNRYFK